MKTPNTSQTETTPSCTERESLVYILHSGRLFGTERMAIATLVQLQTQFNCLLLAPDGEAMTFAKDQGLAALSFSGHFQLVKQLWRVIIGQAQVTLMCTGLGQSLVAIFLAAFGGVKLRHLHIVHGGTDDRLSYGRKKYLRFFAVDFVAVSAFVKQKLIEYGVPEQRVSVIENFLTETSDQQHPAFTTGIVNAIVVARLDPIKRVELLLDAYALDASLLNFPVTVFGTGWNQDSLRDRVKKENLPILFFGYSHAIPSVLCTADLLIHTCPEEPFGLVILEAMAAGIPVLVPDTGGPSSFICDSVNGFVYRANDPSHLAQRIKDIRQLPAAKIQQIVTTAKSLLEDRFAPSQRIADYQILLKGGRL
ncbi:glycosyltransferase [Undibacterium sp.]|uniref:glycosyltransferase n=1 Tax=Undibacterium sp. TaxID=1914977 RepID=UPI0037530A5E